MPNTRQATIRSTIATRRKRAAVSNWRCSSRQPLLRILWITSICQRCEYQRTFSSAAWAVSAGTVVRSRQHTGSTPRGGRVSRASTAHNFSGG